MEDSEIHEIMVRVLDSGIAVPGTKLGERQLAELFSISRDRMRRILQRLGYEGKLELVPNRGARTIDAGLADARVVYEARRVIEGGIAMSVTERMRNADLDALFEQHERERDAIERDDRPTALALGGALHVRLAELTGNELIVDTLRSMVRRTSTLLAFFGPDDGPACSCREHGTIMAALASRDPMRARDAMCSHLSLVETRLRRRPRCEAVEIETLIRSELGRSPIRDVRDGPARPSDVLQKRTMHERAGRGDRRGELSGSAGAGAGAPDG